MMVKIKQNGNCCSCEIIFWIRSILPFLRFKTEIFSSQARCNTNNNFAEIQGKVSGKYSWWRQIFGQYNFKNKIIVFTNKDSEYSSFSKENWILNRINVAFIFQNCCTTNIMDSPSSVNTCQRGRQTRVHQSAWHNHVWYHLRCGRIVPTQLDSQLSIN